MMPGANTLLYAPLPDSSIEEYEKYRHSKTTCPNLCRVHKDYATKTSPRLRRAMLALCSEKHSMFLNMLYNYIVLKVFWNLRTMLFLKNSLCDFDIFLQKTGFPHIFKIHFPYFFNTFSILNFKSSIPPLLFIFRNF